jgi:hypothetical protein
MQVRAEVARAVAGVHQPLTTQPGGRCLTRHLATIHRWNMPAGLALLRPGRRSVSTTGVGLRGLAITNCPLARPRFDPYGRSPRMSPFINTGIFGTHSVSRARSSRNGSPKASGQRDCSRPTPL